MSTIQIMKRLSSSTGTSDSSSTTEPKRRIVSLATYQNWRSELDKELQTLSWLDCATSGVGSKKTVDKLNVNCVSSIK